MKIRIKDKRGLHIAGKHYPAGHVVRIDGGLAEAWLHFAQADRVPDDTPETAAEPASSSPASLSSSPASGLRPESSGPESGSTGLHAHLEALNAELASAQIENASLLVRIETLEGLLSDMHEQLAQRGTGVPPVGEVKNPTPLPMAETAMPRSGVPPVEAAPHRSTDNPVCAPPNLSRVAKLLPKPSKKK